ncbi:MAG TPA: N-acetylglucosamine-6-phosphate deacetylase [Candidatus Limnocylindria bacterium]|nr:N-acetylglucosamine-6-phosphate deacetylase [Candidatus Limnocylindria bacterium]
MYFTNARLILPDKMVRGSLVVRNGLIGRISRSAKPNPPNKNTLDLRGGFLAPGFFDLHIHGAVNRDTMEASAEAFRVITEFHLRGGTTSIALTTVTATEAEILRVLEAAKPWWNKSFGGSRLAGIHIEGPFISKEKPGAQNPKHIRPPRESEWKKFLRFGELITEMTIAPEIDGALPLIRALKRNGTIASGGHTNATEDALQPALRAGLNHATHTFNAMSTATKRGPYRQAGMVEFALAHREINCELIADGVHVAPTLMKMLFNAKGRDGVCLITDATGGAGMKPGTAFQVGGVAARVTAEAALTADGTALAGSTLTMIEAVRGAVQLGGASLVDAVRMASLNPARQLHREHEFGSIEKNKRADLVWFDEQFRVRGVWLDGDVRFLA